MSSEARVRDLAKLRQAGKPVVGCFPLYPPLELLHSLGLTPVVLWGLEGSGGDLAEADRHIQTYACSVARRLAQCVMVDGPGLFDGLFFYNACDTLRNLPEILREGWAGSDGPRLFRLHLPLTSARGDAALAYMRSEIDALIAALEAAFRTRFSEESFAASVGLYARMRTLALEWEAAMAAGRVSFNAYCETMARNNLLAVEDQVELLETGMASLPSAGLESGGKPIIVSGILPPPPAICRLFDDAGLRVVANDLASCFRSHAYTPDTWRDVGDYYVRFYEEHFPCTTLLYTADRRVPALLAMADSMEAAGFVFLGEKYCEYEYFELPYLQGRLQEAGIPVLSLEISIDDAVNVETFRTRIQAFAEMLEERAPAPAAREGE